MLAIFISTLLLELTHSRSIENLIDGIFSDSRENERSSDSNELGRGDLFKRWAPSEIRVDELIQKLGSLVHPARQNRQRTSKRKRSNSLDDASVVEAFLREPPSEYNNDYLLLEPAIDDESDQFIEGSYVPKMASDEENELLSSLFRRRIRRADGENLHPLNVGYGPETARAALRTLEVLKRNEATVGNPDEFYNRQNPVRFIGK